MAGIKEEDELAVCVVVALATHLHMRDGLIPPVSVDGSYYHGD